MQTKLECNIAENGDVHLILDPVTAGRLAGRSIYGKVPQVQEELEQAIALAWYRAGCPTIPATVRAA